MKWSSHPEAAGRPNPYPTLRCSTLPYATHFLPTLRPPAKDERACRIIIVEFYFNVEIQKQRACKQKHADVYFNVEMNKQRTVFVWSRWGSGVWWFVLRSCFFQLWIRHDIEYLDFVSQPGPLCGFPGFAEKTDVLFVPVHGIPVCRDMCRRHVWGCEGAHGGIVMVCHSRVSHWCITQGYCTGVHVSWGTTRQCRGI